MKNLFLVPLACLLTLASCPGAERGIEGKPFGTLPDGEAVELYTLRNAGGSEAAVATYGGTLVSLRVPDREGRMADVVLGYGTLADYVRAPCDFGAVIGRYAGRIFDAHAAIDGKEVALSVNNPPHHLHGGFRGFDKRVWRARIDGKGNGLELSYVSPAGEEGYPGTMRATVRYALNDDNVLRIDWIAEADAPTLANFINHTYFNLRGAGNGTILDQRLTLHADRVSVAGPNRLPAGKTVPVRGTPFDFTAPVPIGKWIGEDVPELRPFKGYDHTWIVRGAPTAGAPVPVARVEDRSSGRVLEVSSTYPMVHFYSANDISKSPEGREGKAYPTYGGFCIEPEFDAYATASPDFSPAVVRPGNVFRQSVLYRFSTVP